MCVTMPRMANDITEGAIDMDGADLERMADTIIARSGMPIATPEDKARLCAGLITAFVLVSVGTKIPSDTVFIRALNGALLGVNSAVRDPAPPEGIQ